MFDQGTPINDTTVLNMLTSMPRFPGREDEDGSNYRKQKCAQQKMLKFIYNFFSYSYEARIQNIEGMAIVTFMILKNGDIGRANVYGDPGSKCGNAALGIVNRMNFICDKWILGKEEEGNSVNAMYTLPVKFKLEG